MSELPIQSKIFAGLYSDSDIAPLFIDEAVIEAMVTVEVALAKVQGKLGVIPADAARQIADAASSFEPDFAEISQSTETSGVPTIALVKQLRAASGDARPYVHWGATSQDIIDTGLVLRLSKALDMLFERTAGVVAILASLADAHRQTVMLGRTRSQHAMPTTFGLKVAGWLDGLLDGQQGLRDLAPNFLRLQFGGAVGTLAALGDQGTAVMDGLAAELKLQSPPLAWHTNRTSMAGLGNQLSLITGTLGKIGQDIVLLSQSEVGEVRDGGGGGGSSTMPQKANPVRAETLVSLARMNAGLIGNMHQALIQEHERGGPGWQLEQLSLPQMVVYCGAALRHGEKLLGQLIVDKDRMSKNIDATNGLVLAEAAGFALAKHMDRAEAQALIKEAVGEAIANRQNLIDLLKSKTDAPVDWAGLAAPENYLGVSDALISRALARLK